MIAQWYAGGRQFKSRQGRREEVARLKIPMLQSEFESSQSKYMVVILLVLSNSKDLTLIWLVLGERERNGMMHSGL